MKNAYLLSGRPGVGKTTLVREVIAPYLARAGGFYTEEVRRRGQRQGFRLLTLDGRETVLASVQLKGPYRVGQYGVNLVALEQVAVPALRRAMMSSDLVVIDEIGKMELLSPSFPEAVLRAIQSGKPLLGTIMAAPHPFADGLRRHPQVQVIEVTEANRGAVRHQLEAWLEGCLAPKA